MVPRESFDAPIDRYTGTDTGAHACAMRPRFRTGTKVLRFRDGRESQPMENLNHC